MLSSDEQIPLGNPVAVLAKNKDEVNLFSNFSFDSVNEAPSAEEAEKPQMEKEVQKS